MKKKILLALLLLFSVALGTHAQYGVNINNIYYNLTSANNEAEVTTRTAGMYDGQGYGENSYSGNITIPSSVTYSSVYSSTRTYKVTSIGRYAFKDCSSLKSVTIPNSVTSIQKEAFKGSSSLTSVTIPKSVTSIGNSAFDGCIGLTSVRISDLAAWCTTITFDNYSANPLCNGGYLYLNGSKVTDLIIPDNVTSISSYAFYGCSMTSVTIPNSVTSIGDQAFKGCNNLTTVTVYKNMPMAIDQNTFPNRTNATLYVPAGSKSAYQSANYWKEFKYIYEIIDFADENVEAICLSNWDTNGNGMLTQDEAEAVTDLGEIFKENQDITSFDELQYFTGLTSIGYQAFYNCKGLTSVTIPNSVTSIGEMAFKNCKGLTSVTIPNSVTSIGIWAFNECKGLTSVTIPNSVTSIGHRAFGGCYGVRFYISDLVAWCNMECDYSFSESHPLYLNGTRVTDLVIPDGVTSIGNYTFELCSGLTSVTIPNSVTSIGKEAFAVGYGGTLTSVHISDLAAWCNISFSTSSSNPLSNAHHLYLNGTEVTDLVIPNSVTSIRNYAFSGCSGLTSVTIPNSVTSIGYYAFEGCDGLTSVHISDLAAWCNISFNNEYYSNPLYYAHHLYLNGTEVTDLVIPNSVTSIRAYAFRGCSGLTSVTIPNSVTSIGSYAFYNCSGLTKVKVEMSSPLYLFYSFSNSANATLYVPKGSQSSYSSANYWKDFGTIKEFPSTDVNGDNTTNVVDVVDIARFVVGTPATTFEEFLADLDGSREVDVADAIVLVNDIAGDTNWAKPMMAMSRAAANDVLKLVSTDGNYLSLQMDGNGQYAAFQFDLWLPEGVDVIEMALNNERRQGHQLLYNKVSEGHYRVVALSTAANSFNGTSGELLDLTLDDSATDDIRVDDIRFVTPDGSERQFAALGVTRNGITTSIDGMNGDDNCDKRTVYNLNGQRMNSPQKGLNIINGRKVVIK